MATLHESLVEFAPFAAGMDGALRSYLLLDAFTDEPLAGNQLAVVPHGAGLSEERMQALARELNLSETVFCMPGAERDQVSVRIFTPYLELPFAGHPILGTAVVIALASDSEEVQLLTRGGVVPVAVERHDGADGDRLSASARMQQPIPSWEPFAESEQLLRALGVEASGLPVEIYTNGPRHVFVELDSEPAVAALSPDGGALARLGAIGVSCFAGEGVRWKTRMFAPGLGVLEDPATGSAAGPLALHLARHGRIRFGEEIEIRQGEELRRPSRLLARAVGSPESVERIEVAGSAVLVGCGAIRV